MSDHQPLVPASVRLPEITVKAVLLSIILAAVLAAANAYLGLFAGMITAPVHKGVINDAGVPFTGHTEYLAQTTHTSHVVMLLAGGGLRLDVGDLAARPRPSAGLFAADADPVPRVAGGGVPRSRGPGLEGAA